MNISIKQKSNGAWVKQFSLLFVVLNEEHQVVTWKLTKKEQSHLEYLKDRNCLVKNSLQYFIIDNCCAWQNKLQGLFRETTKILLDLFHATQPLTKTIIKAHPFQSKCVHDCSLVFFIRTTAKQMRKFKMASKEFVLKKMNKFGRKWKRISETSADGPLL